MSDLSHLARSGTRIAVRVTPRASRGTVTLTPEGVVQVHVTAPPADGRANAETQVLLAAALGLAKTRLRLVRGAGARQKMFEVLP